MRHPERISTYLKQYRSVPDLLREPYDSVTGEQVLNHLLDRNAIEGNQDLTEALREADGRVASALAQAEADWPHRLESWAVQCGFVTSLWWISIWYAARRAASGPTSLAGILAAAADIWITATSRDTKTDIKQLRIQSIVDQFRSALQVGVGQTLGYVPDRNKRGRTLPSELGRFAEVVPAVVVPGSVIVGLELPRQTPGEPASGPADVSISALDVVMQATSKYVPDGDAGILCGLVDDERERGELWRSLGHIHNAARSAAADIEFATNLPRLKRKVAWRIEPAAPLRRPRPLRCVTLTGNLREINLDTHRLRLRVKGAAGYTTLLAKPTLFVDPGRLAEHLGSNITVTGTTRDAKDPPSTLEIIECDRLSKAE